jgi:hypothetical protein
MDSRQSYLDEFCPPIQEYTRGYSNLIEKLRTSHPQNPEGLERKSVNNSDRCSRGSEVFTLNKNLLTTAISKFVGITPATRDYILFKGVKYNFRKFREPFRKLRDINKNYSEYMSIPTRTSDIKYVIRDNRLDEFTFGKTSDVVDCQVACCYSDSRCTLLFDIMSDDIFEISEQPSTLNIDSIIMRDDAETSVSNCADISKRIASVFSMISSGGVLKNIAIALDPLRTYLDNGYTILVAVTEPNDPNNSGLHYFVMVGYANATGSFTLLGNSTMHLKYSAIHRIQYAAILEESHLG